MESENSINITDLIAIVLYVGYPVYIGGAILQTVLISLLRLKQRRKIRLAALGIISTFICSVLLAIIFWMVIPWGGEQVFMLFGKINTPALLAEIFVLPVMLRATEAFA